MWTQPPSRSPLRLPVINRDCMRRMPSGVREWFHWKKSKGRLISPIASLPRRKTLGKTTAQVV